MMPALRPAAILALLIGLAVLAVGMTAGLVQAPGGLMGSAGGLLARPEITLPTVVVAGLVDGINPCSFTLLLLFIAALLATAGNAGADAVAQVRRRMLVNGGAFVLAIFLAYLVLGTGLMQVSTVLAQNHVGARIGALASVLLGLWMLKDYFLPGLGPRLAAPRWVAARVRGADGAASAVTMFGLGALISLCTVPCSGAVYLVIISLLALQTNFALSYGYLLIYNVMFILPLVGILLMATSRAGLNRMARWNLHHRDTVKLILGGSVVALGLVILATA